MVFDTIPAKRNPNTNPSDLRRKGKLNSTNQLLFGDLDEKKGRKNLHPRARLLSAPLLKA